MNFVHQDDRIDYMAMSYNICYRVIPSFELTVVQSPWSAVYNPN